MILKPPEFWQRAGGKQPVAAFFLKPLGAVYHFETQRRLARIKPARSAIPVICIGNITLGGVGKTPFALALANILSNEGHKPHFLTRGYGGTEKGPLKVDAKVHDAAQVGDEALLLAREFKTWVARNKAMGARAIAADIDDHQHNVIVMDDGFQNPTLHKDVSIVLIDATNPFGNGLVFPAGPLREKPQTARVRADIFIFVKQRKNQPVPDCLLDFAGDVPWFDCWTENTSIPVSSARAFIAFCGIGAPQKFFSTCTDAGLSLIGKVSFPDHYRYKDQDISRLLTKAQAQNARLITTRKDFVRIKEEYRGALSVLDIATEISDPGQLLTVLKKLVSPAGSGTRRQSGPYSQSH